MTQPLFVGVDGGGTKCIVRVEDASGKLLGKEVGGPANIRLSVTQTWESIFSALKKILEPLAIAFDDKRYSLHAGLGVAGCEVESVYQAFIKEAHPFQTLVVSSDAHIACLGAHAGQDGAIIIAGTGVIGYQVEAGKVARVSGWGFPHDDEGSGAWIGLEAMRATLRWLDGRESRSSLAEAIFAHFQEDHQQLVAWANAANSTAFAELAPFVIQQSQSGDACAIAILRGAARHINSVHQALIAAQQTTQQPLPLALIGGIAPFLEPYLDDALRVLLRPPHAMPDVGAIMLVQHHLKEQL